MDEGAYRAAERVLFDALGVDVRERWVEVPRTRLRVLEIGEGEPVLFVHGSPNASPTWVALAAALRGRRALLLERPGAALGPPMPVWRDFRREVVAVLESALDQLGLDAVDVVGSSFGGLYAYYLAVDAPERVRRLVQIGAPAGPACLPMPGIFRLLSVLPLIPGASRFVPRPDAEGAKGMHREIGHGASIDRGVVPEVWFSWYAALLRHTDCMVNLCGEVRGLATPFGYRRGQGLADAEIAGLEMPLLYLWGSADTFASPAQGAKLAALTPGAVFEQLDGMGHLPWLDDPIHVADRLQAFLASATRGEARDRIG